MIHARIVGDGLNGKYRQTALSKGADGNACPHHGQKRAKTYSSLMHQHASSPRKRVNVNLVAAWGVCCGIEHAGAAVLLKARTTNHTFWIELVQPVCAPGLAFSAIFHMSRSFIDGLVRKMRLLDFNTSLDCQIKRGNIRELAAQCRDRLSGLAAGAHDLRWSSRGVQTPAECRSSLDSAF